MEKHGGWLMIWWSVSDNNMTGYCVMKETVIGCCCTLNVLCHDKYVYKFELLCFIEIQFIFQFNTCI